MAKYFYIYALMDGLKPFYIGKGSGSRKIQHFRGLPPQDKVEGSSDKHQRIAKIKRRGGYHTPWSSAITIQRPRP